jgi:hypothetical protein
MVTNKIEGNIPSSSDWGKFKEDVKKKYNILISDEHKPYYIK